jgi:hypothetical protein
MTTYTEDITRSNYHEGKISHDEYYLTLAEIAGIKFSDVFIERVRECLDNEDDNLSGIPLREWDTMCQNDRYNPFLRFELKRRGDTLSLSTGVCMRKSMARHQASK